MIGNAGNLQRGVRYVQSPDLDVHYSKYTTLPRMSPCAQGQARTASFYYSLVYDRDQPHLFTSVQILEDHMMAVERLGLVLDEGKHTKSDIHIGEKMDAVV